MILFNKPYLVLCQFTDAQGRQTLADYIALPDLYPAGRLDYDSEGLVVLTNAGWLQHAIAHPRHKLPKGYWVQVEGDPQPQDLQKLAGGVIVKGERTKQAHVERIDPPAIWPRTPPIRERVAIPTTWLAITIAEGRKRQIRHMTAAVGYPTLRLIRHMVGPWRLASLQPGEWHEIAPPHSLPELQALVS